MHALNAGRLLNVLNFSQREVYTSASNSRTEFATVYHRTRPAYQEHEGSETDLKKLVPQDVKEAIWHGVRAKRSKIGLSASS